MLGGLSGWARFFPSPSPPPPALKNQALLTSPDLNLKFV